MTKSYLLSNVKSTEISNLNAIRGGVKTKKGIVTSLTPFVILHKEIDHLTREIGMSNGDT